MQCITKFFLLDEKIVMHCKKLRSITCLCGGYYAQFMIENELLKCLFIFNTISFGLLLSKLPYLLL